jgi:hypothetical protein
MEKHGETWETTWKKKKRHGGPEEKYMKCKGETQRSIPNL